MYILNERQEKLKNEVKAFVDREVIPAASEYDRSGVFPLPLVRRCGELGFAGEALMDGGRYNAVELCVILEELARGSASLPRGVASSRSCARRPSPCRSLAHSLRT